MPRADLLALSPDDLAALTNRGTVKRAQREVENAEVTGELQEAADGTVTAKWSDGVECRLPGGAVLTDSRCSCPATELCRHIVRTVFAYQRQAKAAQPAEAAVATPQAWNPGDISDEELARHFKPAALAQARTLFEKGALIEIVKAAKPTARFHEFACTLRFQVAGDVRYVHCDCAGTPPCIHVPLAVWAFRRLPPGQDSALITTHSRPLPPPLELLDRIDETLLECLEFGVSGAGAPWRDRLARLEAECRDAGLIWPAEVAAELVHQFERYSQHDAAFNPDRFLELVGELLIRGDAIRRDTGAVPPLLVRGSASDHWTDLASARFIGLGCSVRPARHAATLTAFLQDANSGSMVAVSRDFADPAPDSTDLPKDFWQLAQTPIVKGATFAQIGAGQLLTQGGKRAASHELVLGRAKATVNPQNFSWESLRPPALAENFAEIRDRLLLLPPPSLRPRRVAEDFHVCPIAAVEEAAFNAAAQTVEAVLVDRRGERAVLRHPYTSRGSEGAERLLGALTGPSPRVAFVAGPMRLAGNVLRIEPSAVIVETDGGRVAIQPWIDRHRDARAEGSRTMADSVPVDPVESFGQELAACVREAALVGLRRGGAELARMWKDLEGGAESLGLVRLALAIRPVAQGLAEKASALDWSWRPAGQALLTCALLAKVMQEVTFANS